MKTTDIFQERSGKLRRVILSILSRALILTTLIALIYAVENWRGARAWTSTLEELQASGQKIALEDFEPSPVPDEKNAAMHPALRCFTYTMPNGKRAMRGRDDPPDAADADMAAKWKAFLDWRINDGEPFSRLYDVLNEENQDLSQAGAAASALAPALADHQALMNAVEEALSRPFCQWPALHSADPQAVSTRMGYGVTIGRALMETSRFLHVRKICQAIPSGSLSPWDEGVGAKRYIQAGAAQKNIMSFLLAGAIRNQQQELVINLLEFTKPDPERCLVAEKELAAQPLMTDSFQEALQGERAFMIAAISSVLAQENPSDLSRIMSGQPVPKGWERVKQAIRRYGPVGWLKQNMANSVRGMGDLIDAYSPGSKPDGQRTRSHQVISNTKSKGELFHWMEKGTVGIYGGIQENLVCADARQNLLRAALLIAAHRYATGVTVMSMEDLPVELRERIPLSPYKGDVPRIGRNEAGVFTLAYRGWLDNEATGREWSIQIRGW